MGLYVAGLAIDVIEGERGDEKLEEEGGGGAGEGDGEGKVDGPEVSGYSMASIAVVAFFASDWETSGDDARLLSDLKMSCALISLAISGSDGWMDE